MRVAIVFDMEAASRIEDFAELYPSYPAYWKHGRRKLTSDVVAAAQGLLDAGAGHVDIVNHHGAGENGWPNLIIDDLPPGATLQEDWGTGDLHGRVDAMLQVGCHARGGSQSFSSHTILPGLRLRLDGELLAESHYWALNAAVPVIGIVGSEGLRDELGFLSDVPFLAVQGGETRAKPRPLFPSLDASAAAIRAFAADALGDAAGRVAVEPRDFLLEASLQNGDDAAAAMAHAGWTRASLTEFRLQAPSWRAEGDPVSKAVDAAIESTWEPYASLFAELDPSTEERSRAYPPDAFAADDALLRAWHADRTAEWITPEAATRWEGLPTARTPARPPAGHPE